MFYIIVKSDKGSIYKQKNIIIIKKQTDKQKKQEPSLGMYESN